MTESFSFALGLGFLLGLKHATEADHLMAVTTIVSEHRSVWRAALVGAYWGVGHTASLLLAGIVVILLRVAIPERTATLLELAVALMIVFLGGRALYQVLRRPPAHSHAHGGEPHAHAHSTGDARSVDAWRTLPSRPRITQIGWRPLLIGMVHGLAGSAALTLLVLTEILRGGSATLGIAYLLIFGLGSIGGMLLMSALISLPFVFTTGRFARMHVPIQILAGVGSVLFGVYYAWEVLHEGAAG